MQQINIEETFLGIELGSTRIKAVLIDSNYATIATGIHEWGNLFENGVWTYHLDDVWVGLRDSFQKLKEDVHLRYGLTLNTVKSIGISGMMHGYLAFDKHGKQLVPFRTWRNTLTENAAEKLSQSLGVNIPQRWSVAHLFQALLNNESHVNEISFCTTLAGYVHWKLTGNKLLGINDASGMFPIDSNTNDYDSEMISKFNSLIHEYNTGWKLEDLLPKVLVAGETAGRLNDEGAKLLDPSGDLKPGILMCPPEGDAGTGMVATNCIAERTGNISAGTSIFAMIVLEKELSKMHIEIDMVTTPAGKPVAMVHCNSCTSDLDAWVELFSEVMEIMGVKPDKSALYKNLYLKALEADTDCGELLSYNYYSGEPITNLDAGCPLLVRMPNSKFTPANLMRSLLFSAIGTLRLGIDILTEQEHVKLDKLLAHGGLFKTKDVGQKFMAAALGVPVAVLESAGEGGAWGIALLAAYMAQKENDEKLEGFLAEKVFANESAVFVEPEDEHMRSFLMFMEQYKSGLSIERAAVDYSKNRDISS